jgi:predicted dehydrogenase
MIGIGVIGYGYWGPQVVRNFYNLDEARVIVVCDKRVESLKRVKYAYPEVEVTTDLTQVLCNMDVDAVAVVTPVCTHFELAKAALANGKHVFVEKPFTSTSDQAQQLIDLAEKKNLRIMVDHTYLFTGAVKKLRQLIDDGELGTLYYYDSTRVNLGLFQHDVNVIWDLAVHDLSILDHLIREKAEAIITTGDSHVNGCEDLAYITIYFTHNIIAHITVSWLSPVKVRTTVIGGDKRMVVWNDLESEAQVKVYDKGVHITNGHGTHNSVISYRSGDIWAPKVLQTEALRTECESFLDCVKYGKEPINDGHAGLKVVKMLEAADKSIADKGRMVSL